MEPKKVKIIKTVQRVPRDNQYANVKIARELMY